MKTNYVLFVALSFLVLFGWNYTTMKNRPPAPPPSAASAPAGTAAPATPLPSTPVVRRVLPVEKTIGRHRVEFNAKDGGVLQWRMEDGVRASLVLPDPEGRHPLVAFPDLEFSDA